MRFKKNVLVTLLAVSISLFGCGAFNQHQYQRKQVRVPYKNKYLKDLDRDMQEQNPNYQIIGDYQEEIQKREWRKQQEGKGKWAGQYKSGKPVRRIPIQPGYNGYRSLRKGMRRRH